ncbi:MAG: TOMM precursor leader peptide-binding protein [Halobaculum sp.]
MRDAYERVVERVPVPAFNPSFVPVETSDGEIQIRAGPHAGAVVRITDADGSDELRPLLDRIDGTHSVDDLLETVPSADEPEVIALLEHLADRNVIHDASGVDPPQLREYGLVTPYTDDPDPFTDARLVLVGIGRVGHHALAELRGHGYDRLSVFDPLDSLSDRHNPTTDRNHSTTDSHDSESATHTNVEWIDESAVETRIEAADAVCYASDAPAPSVIERVNRITHRTGTPYVIGQTQGYDGFVGPTVLPGHTSCYACFETRLRANVDDRPGYDAYRTAADSGDGFSPFAHVVVGYATLDLCHLLAHGQAFTAGRVLHVDGRTLTTRVDDVLRRPRCPVCGPDRGVETGQFTDTIDVVLAERTSEGSE